MLSLESILNQSAGNLQNLHPKVAQAADQLIRKCYADGIYIKITSGFRSFEDQATIYAQGRTAPGQIVSNAKPGTSYHNYGLAIDYALLNASGTGLIWNVNQAWRHVAEIGKSLGFEWGGDWDGFKDYPHLQMTFGFSITSLLSGKRPPKEAFNMTKEEAEFILAVLGDYWQRMAGNEAIQQETHRVADVLRNAVGIPKED